MPSHFISNDIELFGKFNAKIDISARRAPFPVCKKVLS